jgi:hypothetical protein
MQWLKAVSWIITHAPEIFRKRRIVQGGRKIADREILTDGQIPFTNQLTGSKLEQAGIRFLNRLTGRYWNMAKRFI